MIYNCKITNINEIPILIEYLYSIGYRNFNAYTDIKLAKNFYMGMFRSHYGIYITWAIEYGQIATCQDYSIGPPCIGYNLNPTDGVSLFNIQKLMREKKLKRILK